MRKNIIRLLESLLLMAAVVLPLQAQTTSDMLDGTVKDAATQQAIAGASVRIVGFSSAFTKEDGSFSLKVSNPSAIVEISAVGYATRQVPAGTGKLDIVLYESEYKGSAAEAVTVFGPESSLKLSSSQSVVRENTSQSVAVTPDALMQGYATGVNTVFRSGMPGSGANIYIHGFNTINAGTAPLYVVDGMPLENSSYASSLIGNYQANPLSSIDVKDIESITVMKDGTSLYGLKGANGVVIIKTKMSSDPETRISLHVHTGVTMNPKYLPVLSADDSKTLFAELIQSGDDAPESLYTLPYFNMVKPYKEKWGWEGNTDYYRYNNETDWQKQIYQNGWNQNYYLNVSGGDDVAMYTLSLGYLNQKGLLKNTDFERFNTRFNSLVHMSKIIDFSANMSFVYGSKQLANEGGDASKNPILASMLKAPFMSTHIYDEQGALSPNVEGVDDFGSSNPYVLANNVTMMNINYRFMGSFKFDIFLGKHFTLTEMIGLNYNKEREKSFYPSDGVAFDPMYGYVVYNEAQHRVDRLFSVYNDFYLQFKTRETADNGLKARLGVRYQNNKAENDFGEGYNSSSDSFKSIQYGESILRQIGGSIGSWNWLSGYLTANYSLRSKYFFNATISADATSRSGEKAASVFVYPSLSAAWLISGEEFAQADWLNQLKLRASYGLSGNDEIGNFNGVRYYAPQNILGTYGLVRGNLVNTALKPETVERINVGLDFSAFNERLNLTGEFFYNTTRDMILATQEARQTGFDTFIDNAGSMRNIGFDLGINARLINRRIFKWDLGLNISKYKNEVLDLSGETIYNTALGATIQTKVGQPIGVFYGYQTKNGAVYSTQAQAEADGLGIMQGLVRVPFAAGDVQFVDQNGDKLIDEKDMVMIGDPNPTLYGSIVNTFTLGKWSLNALFTYSLGGDVYNYTRSQMESLSQLDNQSQSVINRWRNEGDVTNIPRAVLGDPMGNSRFSDRWIEDGSYIRLKKVTLSYDFNLGVKFIQNSSVFVTGENLLTLTKYKGLDPESAMGSNAINYGVDPCVTPQPMVVSLGIRIGL